MRTSFAPVLALLTACAADPAVLISYDTTVAAMRTLDDSHASAVAAASSLDDVSNEETAYRAAWDGLAQDMSEHMDQMSLCTMRMSQSDMDEVMMGDASSSMSDMQDAISSHMADHAAHTNVAECHAGELAHHDAMSAMLGDMASYGDSWRGRGMVCAGM